MIRPADAAARHRPGAGGRHGGSGRARGQAFLWGHAEAGDSLACAFHATLRAEGAGVTDFLLGGGAFQHLAAKARA